MNNHKFTNTFFKYNKNLNNITTYFQRNINSKKNKLFSRINSNEIIYNSNKNIDLNFSGKESRNIRKNFLLDKYSELYKSVKKRKRDLSINFNYENFNIKNNNEKKNITKNFIDLNLNFIEQLKKEIKRIKLIQKNKILKKKNLSQTFLYSIDKSLNNNSNSQNNINKFKTNNEDFLTIQKQNNEYTNKKIPYIIKCMDKKIYNYNNKNNNIIFPHTINYENRYKKQNINLKDVLINHNMNSRKNLNSNSIPKIKYSHKQMKNLFKFEKLKNKEILDKIKEKRLTNKIKSIRFNKYELLSKFLEQQSF